MVMMVMMNLGFCFAESSDSGVRKTENLLRKAFRFKNPLGVFRRQPAEVDAMTTSPATPTPPALAPRVSVMRPPNRMFDIRAAIKQQEMTKDLPLPSLTAKQILDCEEALEQLNSRMRSNGGRSQVDREFDTLQVCNKELLFVLGLLSWVGCAVMSFSGFRWLMV